MPADPTASTPEALSPVAQALLGVLERLGAGIHTYQRLAAILGVSRYAIGAAAAELERSGCITRQRVPTENGALCGPRTPYRWDIVSGVQHGDASWSEADRALAIAAARVGEIGPRALDVYRRLASAPEAPRLSLTRPELERLGGVGNRLTAERALAILQQHGLLSLRHAEERSPAGRRRRIWLIELAARERSEATIGAGYSLAELEPARPPVTSGEDAQGPRYAPSPRRKSLPRVSRDEYRAAVGELWHRDLVEELVEKLEGRLPAGQRLSPEHRHHRIILPVLELQQRYPSGAGGAALLEYALREAIKRPPAHPQHYLPTICRNHAAEYMGRSARPLTNAEAARERSPEALRKRVSEMLHACALANGRGVERQEARRMLEEELLPLVPQLARAFFERDAALAEASLREAFTQGVTDFVEIEPDPYGFDFLDGEWSWPENVPTLRERRRAVELPEYELAGG